MDDIFKVNFAGITILFADEITIIFSHKKFDKLEIVNRDLKNILDWFAFNKLVANLSKSYYLLIGCNSNKKLLLQFDIKGTDSVKIIGVTFDKHLSFQQHTQKLSNTLLRKIGVIYRIRNILPQKTLVLTYKTFIQSNLIYSCQVWGHTYESHLKNHYSNVYIYKSLIKLIFSLRAFSSPQ
jgi:hypothetical protein